VNAQVTPFRVLCAAGLFAIFSSTISKSPVLPLFAAHLGADPSGVGFVASVSAFTGVIASIPAGILADRFGKRRMLVLSSLVFATAPLLYLFVRETWQLALVRFYHGFATAVFLPVGMALVSDLFHKERGEKMGWFSTATLLGRFAAPAVGGAVLSALAMQPAFRYPAVYIVCAVAGMATLILALRIPKASGQDTPTQDWDETWAAFRAVLSSRAIVVTSAVEASILFAYGTFETFLPLYAASLGISPYQTGIFLSAQVITLALSKPLMGRFSDRHGREPQIFFGALLAAFCIASFSVAASFISLLCLSIVLGLCLSVVTSATSARIADKSRSEGRGAAMGMLGSIMDIGHTTGPLVAGIVAARLGFGWSFIAAALVLSVLAAAFLFHSGRTALYATHKERGAP
jgi:MFS family permease